MIRIKMNGLYCYPDGHRWNLKMETKQARNYSAAISQPDIIIKLREGGSLQVNEDGRLEAEHLTLENLYAIVDKIDGVQVNQVILYRRYQG